MDKRVYLLTTISFVVGMVELIIGGILDLVALDLGVSTGKAGLLITIFALVFGVSGPVLLFLTGKADRKHVTLVALLIFFIGNIVAIFSATYSMLMLSRIISASSGALLVVLCLTLASHISQPEYQGRAIGLVIMGISGSVVLGLPIGVSLGHAYGWRSPFILVAILTLVLVVGVYLFFGKVPTKPPMSLKKQLDSLKNKKVLFGQLTTFFFLAGHFTLYGYLTPFVKTTMGFDGTWITIVYFVYGAAAVTGGGLGGIAADKFGVRRTLLTTIVLLGICLLVMPYASFVFFWVVLVIWGVLSWAITPPVQSHLIQLSPETSDIQQSLNNAALHLGIAFGTLVGSVVIERLSVEQNSLVGVLFVVLSLGAALLSMQKDREVA
ncbi:MAG TPA: MFS transporter [Virgibacillus sp.]|nr:MFS transporter [Virgibacillus sp.]HLR68978.1 MFS transporter [Virgibacillus sp.]